MSFISVLEDITARKQAAAALGASEAFNRDVLESNPDCLKILDSEGRMQFINVNGCRLLDIDDFGTLHSQPWSVLWPAVDEPVVRAAVAKAASGETARFQAFAHTAKGTPKWWDVIVAPAGGAADATGGRRLISVSRDITALKNAEQDLRIRDRAIAASGAGVVLVDPRLPDHPIVHASDGFERLTGYSQAEVLGRNCRFLHGPGTDPAAVERLDQAVRTLTTIRLTLMNYRKDGTSFWNDMSISPVTDALGGVTHLVFVQSDVSNHFEMKTALQASNDRLALGVAIAGLALAEVDYNTDTTHFSAEAARAFGLGGAAVKVPRAVVHAKVHPDDRDKLSRHVALSLDPAGQGGFAIDHRVVWPSGAVRWLTVRKQVLFTGDGPARRPHRAPVAMMDVTDRKAAEADLLASHARVRLAAEATSVGIWEWNLVTNTIRWDAQMCRLYGIGAAPDGVVLYDDWRVTVLPDDLPGVEDIIRTLVQQGGQQRFEFRARRRGSSTVLDIESVTTVRCNAHGLPEWMLGTNLDITERKQVQRQLQQASAELEDRVNQRTAELQALSLHLQRVREDEKASLARELHDELGGLLTAAKLDLARIRAKVAHDPAVVDRLEQAGKRLNEGIALKRRVIENLRPSALSNLGLAESLRVLCAETSDGLGIPVQADIADLSAGDDLDLTIYRVVQESLTNISKYAGAKTVQVTLRAIDDALQLTLRDDGKGFDVARSLVGRHGISGMRLRVTSLGGSLSLTSSPGCGTCLLATFPLQGGTARVALLDN